MSKASAKRTAVVCLIGLFFIVVDRVVVSLGGSVPAPPAWLLAWSGWIAAGWAAYKGPELVERLFPPAAERKRENRTG